MDIFCFLFVFLFSDILDLSVYQEAMTGEVDDELEAMYEFSNILGIITGVLWIVIFIVTMVFFLMWFRRAYYNLHQLKKNLLYTDGWAVGGWFIPIGNLFIPYRIMKDLYENTRNLFLQKSEHYPQKLSTDFVTVWWVFWVITSVVGYIAFRGALRDNPSIEFLYSLSIVNVINTFLLIIYYPLWIKVVKDYAKVEPLLSNLRKEETKTNIL